MAPSDPNAARRERILSHMNRDHKPELSRYLQHFAGVSKRDAQRSPEMVDVDLDGMVIRTGDGSRYSVRFTPPVPSWDAIRNRVIDMDNTARVALGVDPVNLTEWARPRGFDLVVAGGVVFWFACWLALPLVVPGTALHRFLDSYFPGGAERHRVVVKALELPMLLTHSAEVLLFDQIRLKRYGVPRFSGLWWKWSVNCFIEGFPTFARSKALVEKKQAEKAAKAH